MYLTITNMIGIESTELFLIRG